MKKLLIQAIRIYQICFSALVGQRCRFYPSCSEYARQAIEEYGVRTGLLMAIRRLGRCHPFHPGGVDPVPASEQRPAGKV